MDIQQGNVITSKMMLQLKPGMTKPQVRFVMGTPLISDSFHANRWDYFYQMRKDGKVIEQRRVILDFEEEKLAHVRGDVVPARKEGESGDMPVQVDALPAGSQTVLPKPKEKSWTEKLKFWNSDEETPKAEDKPAEPEMAKPVTKQEVKETPKPAAVEQKKVVPVEAAPAVVEPVVQPEVKPIAQPETVQPPPAPVVEMPAPKVEMKEETAPAPEKPASVVRKQPVVEPVREEKPAPVAKPAAKAEIKQAPKSAADDDLPPEESPGYFDKMLEKIGF